MRLEVVTECEHGKVAAHDVVRTAGPGDMKSVFSCSGGSRRVASTTDLIEALKARGVTMQIVGEFGHFDHHDNDGAFVPAGSYLVFSLEGEKP